jgi:hypothetical protein
MPGAVPAPASVTAVPIHAASVTVMPRLGRRPLVAALWPAATGGVASACPAAVRTALGTAALGTAVRLPIRTTGPPLALGAAVAIVRRFCVHLPSLPDGRRTRAGAPATLRREGARSVCGQMDSSGCNRQERRSASCRSSSSTRRSLWPGCQLSTTDEPSYTCAAGDANAEQYVNIVGRVPTVRILRNAPSHNGALVAYSRRTRL